MIAVVYRSKVFKGKETCYRQCWSYISSYLIKYKGALGSCLHQDHEGYFVIYSKWPDIETKERHWPSEGEQGMSEDILSWRRRMRECVELLDPPYYLEIIEENF